MRRLEVEANILRGSTLAVDEFDIVALCCIEELRRVVSRGQAFGKLLECRTETIVRFVARCPEGVSASIIGELVDLENGIVGRDRLERDTAEVSNVRQCASLRHTLHAIHHWLGTSRQACSTPRRSGGFAGKVSTHKWKYLYSNVLLKK